MLKEDSEVHELNTKVLFSKRLSVEQVEEGNDLAPKFNGDGLIPVVTTDFESGELLMHGYMSDQSLKLSIETNEMYKNAQKPQEHQIGAVFLLFARFFTSFVATASYDLYVH